MKKEFIRLAVPIVSWLVDEMPVPIRRYSHLKLPLVVQLRPHLAGAQSNGKQTTAKLWMPGPSW